MVCLGGDGTIAQVAKGLIMASARDSGMDIDDSESTLPTSSVRLGPIPTGI